MSSTTNNWLAFPGAGLHEPPPGHAMGDAMEPPKLEDFLAVQEPAAATVTGRPFGAGGSSTTIGLSMIKNWLRSQPAPAPADNNVASLVAFPEGDTAVASSGAVVVEAAAQQKRTAVETFGQRTSVYRGVTKHRWTGRYEAHLWDNSCRREGQTRKGRQVYLGGYDKEEKAARAYDLAALKYWGTTTTTNFPVGEYEKELEEMKHMNRQEYVASLRRKSSGFSRGASIYRGVTRHHQHGRWQARIGRVAGNKDLYLGTFSTQEEAAEAYDIAAIKFRGLNAVTNFDMSRYDVKSIIESQIPIGSDTAKRIKDVPEHSDDAGDLAASNLLTEGIGSYGPQHDTYGRWASIAFLPPQLQDSIDHSHSRSRMWCKQEQDGAVVAAAHSLHNLQHFAAVGSTHNFFQPSAVQDTGFGDIHPQSLYPDSVMYSSGIGLHGAVSHSGYAMPVAKLVEQSNGNHEARCQEEDLYNGRNLYYPTQGSPLSDASKYNCYGQGFGYENWVPSASVVMTGKATVSQGLPLYRGNDT